MDVLTNCQCEMEQGVIKSNRKREQILEKLYLLVLKLSWESFGHSTN